MGLFKKNWYKKNCQFFNTKVTNWINKGHLGRYALIHKAEFIQFYDSVEEARKFIIDNNYKDGEYLIQPIEQPNTIRYISPITLEK